MAGRFEKKKEEEACQILLDKLKKGQVDLHENLEHLQPPNNVPSQRMKEGSDSGTQRGRRRRRRAAAGDSLCCVNHLPVRRARTDQLSPCSPQLHHPKRKYRKRLSSTPKSSILVAPPIFPPPSTSLKPTTEHTAQPHSSSYSSSHGDKNRDSRERLFMTSSTGKQMRSMRHGKEAVRGGGERRSRRGGEGVRGGGGGIRAGGGRGGGDEGGRVGAEGGRGGGDEGGGIIKSGKKTKESLNTTTSKVAEESLSIRRRYYRESPQRKKPRGLTVSFLTDHNKTESDRDEGEAERKRSRRDGGRVGMEEKSGENLINSLNSSRYGALEHSRRKLRRSPKPPRSTTPNSNRVPERQWSVREDQRLGYDWIAGVVDAGSVLEDREEAWFQEMKEFRKVNHSECSRLHPTMPTYSIPDKEDDSLSSSLIYKPLSSSSSSSSSSSMAHTLCTQSYIINNRLFPVSERGSGTADGERGEKCPVCEGRSGTEDKEGGTHSSHYIRVSVPRRAVKVPYHHRSRPHRRRSFDSSDSMALNKHCQAGLNSVKPPSLPPEPTLDLKSSLLPSHDAPTSHPPPPPPLFPPSPPSQTELRTRVGGRRSAQLSRLLLNTSHRTEYNLRSRGVHS